MAFLVYFSSKSLNTHRFVLKTGLRAARISLEPDAESEIEILCVTDETGNERDLKTIENINALSLCWDHLAKTFKP